LTVDLAILGPSDPFGTDRSLGSKSLAISARRLAISARRLAIRAKDLTVGTSALAIEARGCPGAAAINLYAIGLAAAATAATLSARASCRRNGDRQRRDAGGEK
ncbi:MAG: hypothetical protein V4491_07480, partial [Pseudomonadota bacterium]